MNKCLVHKIYQSINIDAFIPLSILFMICLGLFYFCTFNYSFEEDIKYNTYCLINNGNDNYTVGYGPLVWLNGSYNEHGIKQFKVTISKEYSKDKNKYYVLSKQQRDSYISLFRLTKNSISIPQIKEEKLIER